MSVCATRTVSIVPAATASASSLSVSAPGMWLSPLLFPPR